MQLSLKQWKTRWLLVLVFMGVSVGLATAYFSSNSWLSGQVFGTSSLAIQVEKVEPDKFAKFLPGEAQSFVWQIRNTGDTPIHLAGRFVGNWDKTELDNRLFKIVNLKYKLLTTQNWQAMAVDDVVSSQSWFFSPTGSESNLLILPVDGVLIVQGDLLLDAAADNQYQMTDFLFSLQVIAKQTTADATWPAYE